MSDQDIIDPGRSVEYEPILAGSGWRTTATPVGIPAYVPPQPIYQPEADIHVNPLAMDAEGELPDDIVALDVVPIQGKEVEITAVVQVINSLAMIVNPLSLEVGGMQGSRRLIVRCKRKHAAIVSSQLTGMYGSPQIKPLVGESDPARMFEQTEPLQAHVRLKLSRSAGLPLRTYKELEENDAIVPIIASMFQLEDNEAALTQIVIHGKAPSEWAKEYKEELIQWKRRQTGMPSLRRLLPFLIMLPSSLCMLAYMLMGEWWKFIWIPVLFALAIYLVVRLIKKSDITWSESMEEMVQRKVNQQAYTVEIRLSALSKDANRLQMLMHSMISAYRIFGIESGNALELMEQRLSPSFDPWELNKYEPGCNYLGDEEIGTIWHLPVTSIPDLMQVEKVEDKMPAPDQVYDEKGWHIGTMGKTGGRRYPVWLPQRAITRSHMMLIGKTRMGKSTLATRLISHLVHDPKRAVVVMDPHDDMVDELLTLIPPERRKDVIYWNFADKQYLPGLNILDITLLNDPEATSEAVGEVCKTLFAKFWGPRMEVVFDAITMTLAYANSLRAPDDQFTILDGLELLGMDNHTRSQFLQQHLPTDRWKVQELIRYWELEFSSLTTVMREQVVMPVKSKLEAFQATTSLMSIVGQPQSTVNVREAILAGKIFLIKTGSTGVSAQFSDFIGSLFLAWVRRILMTQGDKPAEERTSVSLLVDESQTFSGVPFPKLLAEIAKFGGSVIIATQGTNFLGRSSASDQVDDANATSKVLANVATLFTFQLSGEDANKITDTEFKDQVNQDFVNLPAYTVFVRFSDTKGKVIGPFKVTLDPPAEGDRRCRQEILSMRHNYSLPVLDAERLGHEARKRMQTLNLQSKDRNRVPASGRNQPASFSRDLVNAANNPAAGEDPDLEELTQAMEGVMGVDWRRNTNSVQEVTGEPEPPTGLDDSALDGMAG